MMSAARAASSVMLSAKEWQHPSSSTTQCARRRTMARLLVLAGSFPCMRAAPLIPSAGNEADYCAWVGKANGDGIAYCSQWPLQTVGTCTPEDICTDGGATAHYGATCASLGFTRSHHQQNLNFGSCAGTLEQTASEVYLLPTHRLAGKRGREEYCSWVGNVTSGPYCSQWQLQSVGTCSTEDICADGVDADPPFAATVAHYGVSCASLGFTRPAIGCSRCTPRDNGHHTEYLDFRSCGGSPDQRMSDVYLPARHRHAEDSSGIETWVGSRVV